LLLVVGVGMLVLLVIALNVATQVVSAVAERGSEWLGVGEGVVNFASKNVVPVVLSMVVVIMLYRFVPARRLRLRDTVAGAFVTALLFLAISLLTTYLFQQTSQLSVVYGSLAAVLVFLYTVYLYASALLVGAAVAAAWAAPPGEPGDPVGVQVKRAVVGLFVHPADRDTATAFDHPTPPRPDPPDKPAPPG
jgi:YihY family inner membrane protein